MIMKILLNNLRYDFVNTLLICLVVLLVKVWNGLQYVKMAYYKIRGIPCYMFRDNKFGEKMCYRLKDKQ